MKGNLRQNAKAMAHWVTHFLKNLVTAVENVFGTLGGAMGKLIVQMVPTKIIAKICKKNWLVLRPTPKKWYFVIKRKILL